MKKNNIKKNFIWNSIGSTFNACISLFFMIIATRINGVESAGIFTFAYSFACLVQVIAAYSGRPYQVTENNKNIINSDYFWMRFITIIITIITAIGFVLIKQYESFKVTIILLAVLFKITDAVSDYFYSCIQKSGELHIVGKSLLIKAISETALFLIIDYTTKSLPLSLIAIIICNTLICLLYDYRNSKKLGNKITNLRKKPLKELLIKGFPVFAFTILIQYVISAQKYTIDRLMTDEFQTIFGVIVMPAMVLVLVSQFVVLPVLTIISDYIKNKEYDDLNKLTLRVSIYVAVFGLFGVVIAYLIGTQVLSFIYGIPLIDYRIHLAIIIIGSMFYGLSHIISSVMTALRFNMSQLYIYLVTSIVAYFSSNILIISNGLYGAVISYLIVMIVLYVLYISVYLIQKRGLKK